MSDPARPVPLNAELQPLVAQLHIARTLPASELFRAARGYNWDYHPVEVLSEIAARPDCSLLTALTIFCMGAPAYPEKHRDADDPIRAMLHHIHDRVNAGGYAHDPRDWQRGAEVPQIHPFIAPRNIEDPLWSFDPARVAPAMTLPEDVAQARKARRYTSPLAIQTAEFLALRVHAGKLRLDDPLLASSLMTEPEKEARFMELMRDRAALDDLARDRTPKPDQLGLPPATLGQVQRLYRFVMDHPDGLARLHGPSGQRGPHELEFFATDIWYAGFEAEDIARSQPRSAAVQAQALLDKLADHYCGVTYWDPRLERVMHYTRSLPEGIEAAGLRRPYAAIKRGLSGLSPFVRLHLRATIMTLAVYDYVTGEAERAQRIERLMPVSDALRAARRDYLSAEEVVQRDMHRAESFLNAVRAFLAQDVQTVADWERRPRWSQWQAA